MGEQWGLAFPAIDAAMEADNAEALAKAYDAASPTELRYIDWILTVPLMVVEFALLTGVGMKKLFWASVIMLVTGYFGESGVTEMLDAQTWGATSGAVGNALTGGSGKIPQAGRMLQWFVLVGWAIYPVGYMAGTEGWYSDIFSFLDAGS